MSLETDAIQLLPTSTFEDKTLWQKDLSRVELTHPKYGLFL
jgi:hypothetical protein